VLKLIAKAAEVDRKPARIRTGLMAASETTRQVNPIAKWF